jgi:hypothetical protein
VRSLPADAVIAGSPRAVDPIPVVAHRRVLVSYETAIPLYSDYYGEVKARIGRLLDGYYATSMGEVGRFCRDDGLAALLVDLEDFTQAGLEKGTGFGEPFDTRWRASLAPGRAFALPAFAERHAVASEGSLRLVACSDVTREMGSAGAPASP